MWQSSSRRRERGRRGIGQETIRRGRGARLRSWAIVTSDPIRSEVGHGRWLWVTLDLGGWTAQFSLTIAFSALGRTDGINQRAVFGLHGHLVPGNANRRRGTGAFA